MTCPDCGKVVLGRNEAHTEAAEWNRKVNARTRGRMHPYRCPTGHGGHVGHSQPRAWSARTANALEAVPAASCTTVTGGVRLTS